MAKSLHQLDLFGLEAKIKSSTTENNPTFEVLTNVEKIETSSLNDEILPTVSRTPMSFSTTASVSKKLKTFHFTSTDILSKKN